VAQDQKQKVLIAILAVLALGAGSYYFFIRESGGDAQDAVSTAPVERRVREESTDAKVTRRTATRAAPTAERAAPERRERDEVEERTAERRKSTSRGRTDVKKKTAVPVG
jgi:uncharacterized protein HemX